MRGEAWVLRGKEGSGKLVRVRKVRWERLGAGEGSVWWRLEVRLRLRGDAGLVGGRQVKLAHVDRMQRLCGEGRVGEGIRGEDWRSVREMGVWKERGEGGRKHLREVRRGEVLGCVLLHVNSLPVLRRVHLQIHRRPGV